MSVFPWYLAPKGELAFEMPSVLKCNIAPKFLEALKKVLINLDSSEKPNELKHEDILKYIYAVFNSQGYRNRYAEFLKIDFPRLPLPGRIKLFCELARLGGELVDLHLMESPKLEEYITTYNGQVGAEVKKVGWTPERGGTVWIDAGGTKAKTTAGSIGFEGVPEEIWNFHIGGYQVCEKWLKDRKGRPLSADDIAHYQKIVVALSETIRLMAEIDEVINAHGGWPGAFVTTSTTTTEEAQD